MANQIVQTNNLMKQGGAFFCQNFRSSNNGGVINGYSMGESNNGDNSYPGEPGVTYNYGSTLLTVNVSDYFNIRKYGKDSHYSDFTIYKGGSTYATLGISITDLALKKNDYPSLTVGNSRYGIMQDAYGEVCWSSAGKIGRTFSGYVTQIATGQPTYLYISGIADGNITVNDYIAVIRYSDGTGLRKIEYVKVTNKDNFVSDGYVTVDRAQLNSKALTTDPIDTGILVLLKQSFKDLSAISAAQWGVMLQFENYNYVALDNEVYRWMDEDAGDFALALTLPIGYNIQRLTFGKTDSGDRIFVSANRANEGDVFLWDGTDTTWEYKVKFNENISTAFENYIAVNTGIYYTNGYSKKLIVSLPGVERKLATASIKIEDIRLNNNYLLFTSNVVNTESLYRRGFYVYDLEKEELTYITPYTKQWYGKTFGAIIIDYDKEIYLTHDNKISKLLDYPDTYSNVYQFIYNPENAKSLRLQNMYLNIDFGMYNNLEVDTNFNVDMDIIVRCYDFREPFSNVIMSSGISGDQPEDLNKIKLTGTYKVKAGDRIELLVHNAGIIRDVVIVADNILTLNEVITDRALDDTDRIMLNPLKLIGTKSIDSISVPVDKLKINLTNQPTFKKALFEIEFRIANKSVLPRLSMVELQVEVND